MHLHVISTILLLTSEVKSAKILCVFPFPALSHQLVYRPIIKELLIRNHTVTVITTHVSNLRHANLEEIDISYMDDIIKGSSMMDLIARKESFLKLFDEFLRSSTKAAEDLFSKTLVYFAEENRNFDLIIGEPTYPAWYSITDIFKCPLILISPLPLGLTTHDSLGNPSNPILHPDLNLPIVRMQQFHERLVSALYAVYGRYVIGHKHFRQQDRIARKYLNRETRDGITIQNNADLVIVQTIPGFHPARPTVPAYIELSGLHIQKQRDMSKDLQDFMDSATAGVVYASFGSVVTSTMLSTGAKVQILAAFSLLPYKVLWKLDGELPEDIPNHVWIQPWYPQQDLLRHKNMKLFITHCGQQSISEALTFGIPMIGIPFFGDQLQNAHRLDLLEVGLSLDKDNLDEVILRRAILEVIETPRYRRRAEDLADIAVDQPVKSLDKAIWWIEYVLRHKGAKHLRCPAIDTPLYQHFLLDVMLLFGILSLLAWISIKYTCRILFKVYHMVANFILESKHKQKQE